MGDVEVVSAGTGFMAHWLKHVAVGAGSTEVTSVQVCIVKCTELIRGGGRWCGLVVAAGQCSSSGDALAALGQKLALGPATLGDDERHRAQTELWDRVGEPRLQTAPGRDRRH